MANFNMSVPHHLPQDEALDRIKNLLGEAKRDHGDKISDLTENWNGNTGTFSFKAMGFAVSGTLTVQPTTIDIDADLPFAASMFKGTIKSLINQKAGELLK